MKTSAQRMHRHNKHDSGRHVVKTAPKGHRGEAGLSGENEFLAEPPRKAGVRPPREKAVPEFKDYL